MHKCLITYHALNIHVQTTNTHNVHRPVANRPKREIDEDSGGVRENRYTQ